MSFSLSAVRSVFYILGPFFFLCLSLCFGNFFYQPPATRQLPLLLPLVQQVAHWSNLSKPKSLMAATDFLQFFFLLWFSAQLLPWMQRRIILRQNCIRKYNCGLKQFKFVKKVWCFSHEKLLWLKVRVYIISPLVLLCDFLYWIYFDDQCLILNLTTSLLLSFSLSPSFSLPTFYFYFYFFRFPSHPNCSESENVLLVPGSDPGFFPEWSFFLVTLTSFLLWGFWDSHLSLSS